MILAVKSRLPSIKLCLSKKVFLCRKIKWNNRFLTINLCQLSDKRTGRIRSANFWTEIKRHQKLKDQFPTTFLPAPKIFFELERTFHKVEISTKKHSYSVKIYSREVKELKNLVFNQCKIRFILIYINKYKYNLYIYI